MKKENIKLGFTEHRFNTIGRASIKVQEIKKTFGYSPDILEVTGNNKHFFAVIQPYNLKPIKRRKQK
jgi:hypothetical protein